MNEEPAVGERSARVIVVGAGPCGSALALQLVRAGIAVELVEARADHQRLPRGEGLMPSGLEALSRLGLASALAEVDQIALRSWAFWLERQPLFSVAEPIGVGPPCTLISTPQLLDRILREASRWPQLRWHPGCTAMDLRWSAPEGRVRGVVLDNGRVLDADLVVACDGRDSQLRRLAGLKRQEDPQAVHVLWFVLEGEATAALERWLDGRFITLVGERQSLAVYSPAGGGLRLGWLVDEGNQDSSGGDPGLWPERWASLSPADLAPLWRNLPAELIPAPMAVSVRPSLAPRWQRPGLLLLGDAAHPMSPLRAQGLNVALRDAVVAGERLIAVLASERWQRADEATRHAELDGALGVVEELRHPEIVRIQALQRQELERALLLRRQDWLRRLLAATASWSGPLLARRWQAGQPTLRRGLPLS